MKKIILLLLCLLLCGCAPLVIAEPTSFDGAFVSDKDYMRLRRNQYTTYYEYYLPSDMSIFDSDSLSTVLYYNESKIIMNVNISGILNNYYYGDTLPENEGFFDGNKLVYHREDTYLNIDNNEERYSVDIYDYDDKYFVYMLNNEVLIYAICEKCDIEPLCSRLLLILKTVNINEKYVREDYSRRDIIDYEKKQVNLFETIKPVNGNVNDLMVDGAEISGDE